jgi:hypothetical protein
MRSCQACGAPKNRDAEDAEPRLTARPRRTRYNRTIGRAAADLTPADASLVRGTADGMPLSMKAVPLDIETLRLVGSRPTRTRTIRLCRVPFRVAPSGAAASSGVPSMTLD